MSASPRVLLMQLSQRTSAKGNAYLSGWLGKASVVAFQAEEPDKWGNLVWEVFVSTPEPRAEAGQERPQARPGRRPQSPPPGDAPANRSARPVERGSGWRGSEYRRPPRDGAGKAPAGDGGAFPDDELADLYR